MIEIYAKEFVGIGSYIRKKYGSKKGYVLADKKVVEEMLDKNKYDTADNKLKIWKALKWTVCEERRTTQRVYVKEDGKYRPYIKMDETMLNNLSELIKT